MAKTAKGILNNFTTDDFLMQQDEKNSRMYELQM